MAKFVLKFVVTIIIAFNYCAPAIGALPPNIKICPGRSNIAQCVKGAIENLKPVLKTGHIAPGFNVEAVDPLAIGDISVNPGFELKISGNQIYGITDFKIDKLRLNVDKVKLEMLLTLPKLSLKAKYSLNWKIALLNLQGKGDAYTNLVNTKAKLKLTGSTYLKHGVEYIKIDAVNLNVQPSQVQVRFENLFNGQKGLEEVANDVINQNIKTLQDAVLPEIERGIEKTFLKISNQFFGRFPKNEIFPH